MLNRRLEQIAERLDALAWKSASFWKRFGPDRRYGGFYGTLDQNGLSAEPRSKSLIQQVRHLWSLSIWHRCQEPTTEVRALADNLYAFVCDNYYVPATGEYAALVDEAGRVLDPKPVLYAQAFTIYGLAEYARSFAHRAAGARALDLFRRIDARAHDEAHGGYLQLNDAPWLPPGAVKETNTHIHLMEAFSTLFAAGADPVVGQRLSELTQLLTQKLLQPAGYIHQNFTRQWDPLGEPAVSYGHDLETYWLLDDALRSLGRRLDPTIMDPARQLAINSAEWGYDHELGGYFEEGPPAGAPTKLEKVWWVQAEAIPGLFRLFEQTAEPRWLDRIEGTLNFIETRLLTQTGEWYWGVLPDGSVGPRGPFMGEHWKASYHVLRALVFTQRWIAEQIAERLDRGAD